jgi:hypothetical protein
MKQPGPVEDKNSPVPGFLFVYAGLKHPAVCGGVIGIFVRGF